MAVDYNVIGDRIKSMRKERGVTQYELAKEMNVSVAYISRIERGCSKINLKRMAELAEKLNYPINYIVEGVVEKSNDYLNKELSEIWQQCSPDRQKIIFEIAKLIAKSKNLK